MFSFHDAEVRGASVVITGGSRGLGLALAREFERLGANVSILARTEEDLSRAREILGNGNEVWAYTCDVRNGRDVQAIINDIARRRGGIDILVNNAGTIQVGPFDHMTIDDYADAMNLHFWAPLFTMLSAIPHMREKGGGRIANISSIGGKIGVPHLVPYCASKHALVGLSDALRAELRRENIFVTTVSPGLMRTGSSVNAKFKGQHEKEYAWFAASEAAPILSMSAVRAAGRIVRAIRRGRSCLTLGWAAKMAELSSALLPELTAEMLAMSNRFLPGVSLAPDANTSRTGWDSMPLDPVAHYPLFDRTAVAENNESRGRAMDTVPVPA